MHPRDRQDADEHAREVVRQLGAMTPLRRRAVLAGLLGAGALAACQQAPPAPTAQGSVGGTRPAGTARPADATKPAPAEASQPKRGGMYKAASTTDAVSLHPYKTTDTASR